MLRKLEDAKAYDTPMYGTVEAVLSSHFTTRLTPHPDCWYDCFKGLNKKIYVAMQGASEFTLGGELAAWSITTRLKAVNVPTLVVMGEHDTMYDIRLSLSLSLSSNVDCVEERRHNVHERRYNVHAGLIKSIKCSTED